MDPFTLGIVGVIAMVVLVFVGVRVFYAAAIVGLVGMVSIVGWEAGAGMVGTIPHSKAVTYTLSVLPMFILIGFLAFHAGLVLLHDMCQLMSHDGFLHRQRDPVSDIERL